MTDKTREDAIALADKEMLGLIKEGYTVNRYHIEKDRVVFYRDSIENSWTFTPPKPEFKRGTFGKFFDDFGMFNYGKLDMIENGVYYSDCHSSAPNFTPIYQNDPALERAFELACIEIDHKEKIAKCELCSYNDICDFSKEECIKFSKEYFLSQAKKELKNEK